LALSKPDHFPDAGGDFSIDSRKSLICSFSSSSDVIGSLLAGFKTSIGTGNDGHSTTRTGLLLQPLNTSSETIALGHAPRQYLFGCFIGFSLLFFALSKRLGMLFVSRVLLSYANRILQTCLDRSVPISGGVRHCDQSG
jgi:hypothetical protein